VRHLVAWVGRSHLLKLCNAVSVHRDSIFSSIGSTQRGEGAECRRWSRFAVAHESRGGILAPS